MKNSQKGFVVPVLIAIIVVLVIGGGVYIYQLKQVKTPAVSYNETLQVDSQIPPRNTNQNVINEKPQVTNANLGDIPNVIKSITTNKETASQSVENIDYVANQIRSEVRAGNLQWFKDPIEVVRRYGNRLSIPVDSQYFLEQGKTFGEYSGLFHATVLAFNTAKTYRVHLIAEQSEPAIWFINAVVDIQNDNKLRVTSFHSVSTYDIDKISHQEIVRRFGDGTTMFYLNVKNPIVNFSLNRPANEATVNSGSIIVKVNSTILSGAVARAIIKQETSHGETFMVYSIQVDLSGIANLSNYAGQNIQIILTDKIKDNFGGALEQCNTSYNKGECISDISGQKVKVFGAELKLYNP